MAVVIDLVVASSNNACLCALNGVAVCVEWGCCLNKAQFSQDCLAQRPRQRHCAFKARESPRVRWHLPRTSYIRELSSRGDRVWLSHFLHY